MGIKSISLTMLIVFSLFWGTQAQGRKVLLLKEIFIDTISIQNKISMIEKFGILKNERSWTENHEDYSKTYSERTYDSVIIQFFSIKNKVYIDWIKVVGSSHIISIRNTILHVKDSIVKLRNVLPTITEDYYEYIKKNNKSSNVIIYFGFPLEIKTNTSPSETYNGSLKFGIKNKVIEEILIDFRSEGEYD